MHPLLLLFFLFLFPINSSSKSTIEPCQNPNPCSSLLHYTLPAPLKLAQAAALFQADPFSLLAANSLSPPNPNSSDVIVPAGAALRVPVDCSCDAGIRRAVVRYVVHAADTLTGVAESVFGGLVSVDQIIEANSISDGENVDPGRVINVPLPCYCFNYLDNQLPAVFITYVVKGNDSLDTIAAGFSTTVSDVMNVNAMVNPSVGAGDILAIALPACTSSFSRYAADNGLIAARGSSILTAGRCVQCTCGPTDLELYCLPTMLPVSCSNMACSNSGLMLGGIATRTSDGGCSVTSCSYAGVINGTITTQLTTSLQPKCPVLRQLPGPILPPVGSVGGPAAVPASSPRLGSTGFSPRATGLGPTAPSGKVAGGAVTSCLFRWAVATTLIFASVGFLL